MAAEDNENRQDLQNAGISENGSDSPTALQQGHAGQSIDEPFAVSGLKAKSGDQQKDNLDFILDIPLEITVQLGRTKMLIHDLLKLGQGSVIELSKPAGETLEILANDRLIAKGDVVVINDKYGIRLTEVISPVERLEQLK